MNLNDWLQKSEAAPESFEKGMAYVDDWAMQFAGTAMHVTALQCLKDMMGLRKEREKFNAAGKSWREEEDMAGSARKAYREKRMKERSKLNDREDAIRVRMAELEERLLDQRIKDAQMQKSFVADDGKPGKSLKETSTDELKATLAKLKPTDPGAQARIKAIKAELKSRGGGGMEKAKMPSAGADISPEKARQILHDGTVHGKPITDQQRKFFGAIGGHLPAPKGKVKKSMSYMSLEDFLEKAEAPDFKSWLMGLYDKKGSEETKKSMDATIDEWFAKAEGGPFIGPRGGKWADAKHTIPWDEKRSKAGKGQKKAKEHDPAMATELALVAENESQLYNQIQSVQKNLVNKIASGKYDHAQAGKLWQYVTDNAAKLYEKQYMGSGQKIPPADRAAAARSLADDFHDMAVEGEFNHMLNKKNAKAMEGKSAEDMKNLASGKAKPGEGGGAKKKSEQNRVSHEYGTMKEHTKDLQNGKKAVIRAIRQQNKGDSYHVRVETPDGKPAGKGATHDVYLSDHGGDEKAALAEAKKKHAELSEKFSGPSKGSKKTTASLDKKPVGHKMSVDMGGETYGAEKMKSGNWQVWTESGSMGREQMDSATLADLVDKAKKDKAKKSLDGIEGLEDWMQKSGGLPTHQQGMGHPKSSAVEGGSADGGELAGVGMTSGSSDSAAGPGQNAQGQLSGVSTGGKEKLSDDDADVEGQMKPHKKPIETIKKSRFPADQREAFAREQAAAVSQLQKSEDVYIGPNAHPFSSYATHASGDAEASELVKSEGFYHGRSPQTAPGRAVIDQAVLCKSINAGGCEEVYSAALTACPGCGAGTVGHRHLPGGEVVGAQQTILEKSMGPGSLLRRPPEEPDVKIG